ncbi:MAG: glycosyltransferase [Halobacteriota archaeon]
MHVPQVSVLMKSYNHERFIAEAIESVLRQSFDDFELLIVDDASTDRSHEIIEGYRNEDSRIRTLFHTENLGITPVVNDGIDASKGTFIAQIDSDDVWREDKLQKQMDVLASNENLLVWSEGEIIDRNGRVLCSFSDFFSSQSHAKSGNIFHELAVRNYIFGSSLAYKRANLGDLRYDERLLYVNDYKFLLELARQYEFYYIPEPLARYRVHGENALVGSGPEADKRRRRGYMEEILIRKETLQRYDHELPPTTKAAIYSTLGDIYRRVGERRDALRSFLQAIRYDPLSGANKRNVRLMLATLEVRKPLGGN